ncbi:hypothetical protein [Blautia producta]|uniref:hypothetical protein n=1 Tax=Blautia producta TaxID=33035 RepID=UPI0031B586B1
MERCKENGEMNWLMLTVWGTSFMRYISHEYGCTLDSGFVLVADDQRQARRFITEYKRALNNGIQIMKWNTRCVRPENYHCAFLLLQKEMKEEEIVRFLMQQDFLPIVVVGGILPDFLKTDFYIFKIKNKDIEGLEDERNRLIYSELRQYIIENVEEVCTILQRVETSTAMLEYDGPQEMRGLFRIMVGISSVFGSYIRKTRTEAEVSAFSIKYLHESKVRIFQFSDFSSGENLRETFSQLLWKYVEENERVKISDISMVDGETCQALRESSVILYDLEYYYLPPELFRDICQPLLETISIPEVKKQLKTEGILYCNSMDYTVKKQIINVFGNIERPRLLWICKEELLLPDNLFLEEVLRSPAQTEEDITCLIQRT